MDWNEKLEAVESIITVTYTSCSLHLFTLLARLKYRHGYWQYLNCYVHCSKMVNPTMDGDIDSLPAIPIIAFYIEIHSSFDLPLFENTGLIVWSDT